MKVPHPTDTPSDLPEWASTPIYPSALFGGTRDETWTPTEVAALFLGFGVLSDGLSTLRVLLGTPTDASVESRTEAIGEASDWMDGAQWWMEAHASQGANGSTDRGEMILEITLNIGFLLESIGEHIGRLSHGIE